MPDKPSIVVLPFVNLSEDPKQEYFSDGITEELTASLSRLSGLFVISRNSAFFYKSKAVKMQDISKELGVKYVLEGSVRKAKDEVRITAQLIDATTDHHLWTERYDRPLQDIFAVQDEIAQKIVTTLKLQLSLLEQGYLVRKTTDNLEAYDYYLRGVEFYVRAVTELKKEANEQARQMFERALALDPQYAMAYGTLGSTYWLEFFRRWGEDPTQSLEQAFTLAQQAVALDESLPYTRLLLGRAHLFQKQHEQAIAEMKRAMALAPTDADSHQMLGLTLVFAGQLEEGIELTEKAMRLNPRHPVTYLQNLVWAYRVAGRCEEAIAVGKRALALTPNYIPTHVNLATCYIELGREEEAQAEAAEVLRIDPNYSIEAAWRPTQPFKDPAVLERFFAAARKAGLK